jgi:hypothetical protein
MIDFQIGAKLSTKQPQKALEFCFFTGGQKRS